MPKETESRVNIEGLKLNVNGHRTHYLKAGENCGISPDYIGAWVGIDNKRKRLRAW